MAIIHNCVGDQTDGINANWGLGSAAIVGAMLIARAFEPQIELPPTIFGGLKRLSQTLKPIGDY